LHFLIFIGLDYSFDFSPILDVVSEALHRGGFIRRSLILLSLAITSFKWWMKRLERTGGGCTD
jgi:DMSO/TMAO reductase YedYZ heme-binding membrane subunit